MEKVFTNKIKSVYGRLTLFAAVVISLLFINNVYADGTKKLEQKSFDVKPGEKLTINLVVGDVKIKTWDKNECSITVYGNSGAEKNVKYEFEKISTGVKIKSEKTGGWLKNLLGTNVDMKFEILVPKDFELDIETSGGDIDINNVNGSKFIHTSGGDVNLESTSGTVKLTTSGGDISIESQKGNIDLETSGGDISGKNIVGDLKGETSGGDINVEVSNGKVDLETSGGDIKFKYKGENKGISLRTSGGDVNAIVPSTIKADADFYTYGGEIECKVSATKTTKVSSQKFIAELNGGGPKFIIGTSGGDIVVE